MCLFLKDGKKSHQNTDWLVLIENLIAKKTVEDHLIKILEKKLDLFKNTIGELETILGYMTSENDPESFVMEAFVDSYG